MKIAHNAKETSMRHGIEQEKYASMLMMNVMLWFSHKSLYEIYDKQFKKEEESGISYL